MITTENNSINNPIQEYLGPPLDTLHSPSQDTISRISEVQGTMLCYYQTPEEVLLDAIESNSYFKAKLALAAGADIEIVEDEVSNITPFQKACGLKHLRIAELLLEHGANIEASDLEGKTALHKACIENQKEVVQFLLRHKAKKEATDLSKRTPFHWASTYGYLELVELLFHKNVLDMPDGQGQTPLHLACNYNQLQVVAFLLEKNANIHSTDLKEKTPLQLIACKFIKVLQRRLRQTEIAKLLLQKNASIDGIDEAGQTLLHSTCCRGNSELTRLFLGEHRKRLLPENLALFCLQRESSNGNKVDLSKFFDWLNAQDKEGNTALHLAIQKQSLGHVQLFIQEGAALLPNNKGKTPLDLALEMETPPILSLFKDSIGYLKALDDQGKTPLHNAVEKGNKKSVEFLLSLHPEVNARDDAGKTPLYYAVTMGRKDLVAALIKGGAQPSEEMREIALENRFSVILKELSK